MINIQPAPGYFQPIIANINREKILRFIQFYAKFYIWTKSTRIGKGESSAQLATWKLLIKQIILIRRLSRLGSNVSYIQEVGRLLVLGKTGQEDAVLYCASIGHKLGLAGYLTCDAAVALDTLGLLPLKGLNIDRLQKQSSLWWAFSITCNVMICLHSLRKRRLQTQTMKKGDVAASKDQYNLCPRRNVHQLHVKIISLLCDLVIAIAPLSSHQPGDGIIGLCGMGSTVLNVWLSMQQCHSMNRVGMKAS